MADVSQKILFQIVLDTVKAAKSIDELNALLKEQKKAFESAAIGSEAYKKAGMLVSELNNEIRKLKGALDSASGEVQKSFKSIQKATGDLLLSWKTDFHDMSDMQASSKRWAEYKNEIEATGGEIEKITEVNKKWKDVLAQAAAAHTQHHAEVKKSKEEIEAENKAIIQNRIATNEANYVLKQRTIIEQNAKGSIQAIRAELGLVSLEWSKLSKEERENSEKGKELTVSKLALTNQLKSLEAATGDARRNVGNYTNTIVSLQQKIEDLTASSATMDIGSKEFKSAQDEIKRLRTQIGQAQGTIDEFGRSTRNTAIESTRAYGKFTEGVIAGFGATKLIFGDNEDAQKALLKATQAIQLVQAARAITEGVIASKIVISTALTFAQAAATKILTIAQRGLNAAMNSNPIMLIITALITLVGVLASSSSAFGEDTESISGNTDALISNKELAEELAEKRRELNSEILKSKVALLVETKYLTDSQAEKVLATMEYHKKIRELDKEDEAAQEKNRKDSWAIMEKYDVLREKAKENWKLKLRKIAEEEKNEAKEAAKKTAEDATKAEEEKNKKIAEARKKSLHELMDLNNSLIMEARDREIAIEKTNMDRRIAELKANADIEIGVREQLIQKTTEASRRKIEEINKKYDADELMRKMEVEKERIEIALNAEIEGSEKRIALKLQTLETEKEIELTKVKEGTETAGQERLNIINKYNQLELNARQDVLDAIFDNFIKSESEELELKRINLEKDGSLSLQWQEQLLVEEKNIAVAAAMSKGENVKLVEAKYQKEITDLYKEEARQREETQKLLADNILASMDVLISASNEIERENMQRMSEEKLDTISNDKEAALNSLQDQKERGLLTDSMYKEKEAALNKKFSDLELVEKEKAFELNKELKKDEAMITFALELLNIAAMAAANPANAVTAGGAGIAQYGILAGAAGIRYAAQVALIDSAKFAQGGNIAFEGGEIPAAGGMIKGQPHGSGGVRFRMGNRVGEADGRKGEAYIINTSHNPYLKAMASAINVAGGGKPFDWGGVVKYTDGGFANRNLTSSVINNYVQSSTMAEQLKNVKIVTVIEDVRDANDLVNEIESRATI